MRQTGRRQPRPSLITEAPPSPKAEFQYRRRRYALTMGFRVVCLVLAFAFYHYVWLWPIFAAGAVVLPWVAVVLANDRLPARRSKFQRYLGLDSRRTITTAPPHRPESPRTLGRSDHPDEGETP